MTVIAMTARPSALTTLLTQDDIARAFGLSPRTLEAWRVSGDGPPYLRLSGRCVRYEQSEVEAWLRGTRRA
jgi:predicted DNA-binding transcriptional regulator AlpA